MPPDAVWQPVTTALPGPTRADAYLNWAQASDFRDGRPQTTGPGQPWVRVLLGLKKDRTAEAFATWLDGQRGQRGLWIPGHYRQPPRGLTGTTFCTAVAHREFVALLAVAAAPAPTVGTMAALAAAAQAWIEGFEIGFEAPQPDFAAAPPVQDGGDGAAPVPVSVVVVVVGIIDDGLAFAHRRFCVVDAQGLRQSRMLALWDQSEGHGPTHAQWGTGRLHSRELLDNYLASCGQGPGFDEDAAYAKANADYAEVRHRITHGTHVMDLACGADATTFGEAAHIVGVQLPPAAIADTSCASMTPFLLDAIRFVVSSADAAAGAACPVVINLSMGNIAGPHDGSSMLEMAIDELIALRRKVQPRFEIVLPEGNSLQSQTHAWARMDQVADEFELDWIIQPDDGTSSFLELWLRPQHPNMSAQKKMAVALYIKPPGSLPAVTMTLDLKQRRHKPPQKLMHNGQALALCGLFAQPANGRHPMGLLAVAPTACYGPWSHCAPSGAWRITVKNLGCSVYANLYVQRDDVAFGRGGRGRQGVLDDGCYQRYDAAGARVLSDDAAKKRSFVRRAGTINGLATGWEVRVAGGVQAGADGQAVPARYSSVPIPIKIDRSQARRLALTEDSAVLHGVLAAGSRSGSTAALSGTSMAAPQWVREIAQGWLAGPAPRAFAPSAVQVADANFKLRDLLRPEAELAERSRRRRGDSV